ncbi:MAG: hypothetical protein M3N49_00030 [Candidatus Eremiobacteraeota bacterium]|nr:hypothetical protein [Candidatus Eremiobacteraeota bacterium]
MSEWPPEYDATPLGQPHWTRQQALDAGHALADYMLSSVFFADRYLGVVKQYYNDQQEYSGVYLGLIEEALQRAGLDFHTTGCNAHDYANTHRAAWLFLFETFARLVDKNPHKDPLGRSLWGDPDYVGTGPGRHRGISTGEDPIPPPLQENIRLATEWAKPGRQRFEQTSASEFVRPDYHNIPNLTGSFAISTDDIPAPTVRV